jgi:hypothetical protein
MSTDPKQSPSHRYSPENGVVTLVACACLHATPAHGIIAVAMIDAHPSPSRRIHGPAQVLFASLIGTTIELFDFYIYATAAVLVFPALFFPRLIRRRAGWHRSPPSRSRFSRGPSVRRATREIVGFRRNPECSSYPLATHAPPAREGDPENCKFARE